MNQDNSPRRPCLLLVDDTPENIELLAALLKSFYDLKIANRGEKALEICQSPDPVDLILLDIMMPGMDGYEVCRTLRSQTATKDIPILFLTAKVDVEDLVKGFEVGGNDYLTKPFEPAEMLARVRTHLTLRAQQVEIARRSAEQKELLHIMCHDVANHFTVLRMALDLAGPEAQARLGTFFPLMTAAVNNGINLTEMVRELRFSEDKEFPIGPVALRPVFEECLLLLQARIEEKGLVVSKDIGDLSVMAEPCLLANSVFNNILTNAVKFSHPGGRLFIAAEREAQMVRVSIRDCGIGMPPGILETLFDITRSHSRPGTAGERGTGFGMPLMGRFVRRFGGRIEVVSRDQKSNPEDHGTEFRIWLQSSIQTIP